MQNERFHILTVTDLFSRIVSPGPDPIFMLGAGASVKSGVPMSGDIVRLAMRWLYAQRHGWKPDDPRIAPSDVQRLLEEQAWYRHGVAIGDFFPPVIELISQPRELRRDFLLHLISQATIPSAGYQRLALALKHRVTHTVLTTNFDDLLRTAHGPGALIAIGKGDEYQSISTAPRYPQIVYLHGQAEYYMDRNLHEEVEHLDSALVERLLPLLRDHPLVVVGYRGAEPSVMQDLLLKNVDRADTFRHGIYWCIRGRSPTATDSLSPLVQELAQRAGRNFSIVPITDFDALLTELWAMWEDRLRQGDHLAADPASLNSIESTDSSALPFDLRPAHEVATTALDWEYISKRLLTYARRMDYASTPEPSQQWCERQLINLGLATPSEGGLALTNAGTLLLTEEPRRVARGAYVELRTQARPPRAIDGDLWQQHDTVLALLGEHNRPVRMKGARSETLQPYPDEALKEVVANALMHRDYADLEPTVVTILPDAIRVESPGGLEQDLIRRLLGTAALPEDRQIPRDVLQRRIAHGDRGSVLTAYRNRVLADLFFGTGVADKAGSGLADALETMEAAGGRLIAEVAEDNRVFTVTLYRRPARIDERTRTARPTKPSVQFRTNLLEVLTLPEDIWSAPTTLRRMPDPKARPEARDWPRFVSYDGRLYTFSDLNDTKNPLQSVIDGTDIRHHNRDMFAGGEDGENRLIYLLNEVLFHHLAKQGLRTDWDRKRAYYECTRGEVRHATYRARVHRSKRRVAWWQGKERKYCVHKAASFRFERYGAQWALRVLPTYVFTFDGAKDRIGGPEASSLATRFSTEDYNTKVSADIFFWRAILAGDADRITLDAGLGTHVVLVSTPAEILAMPPADAEFGDHVRECREEPR